MGHVLIIEDNPRNRDEIAAALTDHGLDVDTASTGRQGLARAVEGNYDAIVLDRMLPGEPDGLGVLRALRQIGIHTPVLILSAVGSAEERVIGLRAGADDYLVKPFVFDELTARLDNLLRNRTLPAASEIDAPLVIGALSLDKATRTARYGDSVINLLPKEWLLLIYIMRRPGQVLTRTMIFEEVWGYAHSGSENVIDVHVSRLRRKLETAGASDAILTVRGQGYTFRAPD